MLRCITSSNKTFMVELAEEKKFLLYINIFNV